LGVGGVGAAAAGGGVLGIIRLVIASLTAWSYSRSVANTSLGKAGCFNLLWQSKLITRQKLLLQQLRKAPQ
jgi:hypothetical protein